MAKSGPGSQGRPFLCREQTGIEWELQQCQRAKQARIAVPGLWTYTVMGMKACQHRPESTGTLNWNRAIACWNWRFDMITSTSTITKGPGCNKKIYHLSYQEPVKTTIWMRKDNRLNPIPRWIRCWNYPTRILQGSQYKNATGIDYGFFWKWMKSTVRK